MLFTGNAIAETSKTSDEAVLNNVLSQLLEDSNFRKDKNKVVEVEQPKLKSLSEENIDNGQAPTKTVSEENVNIPLELHQNNLKANNLLQGNSISTEKVLDSNGQSNKLLNEDLIIVDVNSSEKEMDIQQNEGHMFLLNVPIQTEVRVNVDLVIPPFRNTLSYYKGKLVAESPFKYSESVTFCKIEIEESGMWRRFKAEKEKVLVIESNISNKVKYASNVNAGEIITVYETTFKIDNPHIKAIVCETSEKELPLTIKDLQDATGNLFKFSYTPMLDI